jgi:hypothetical protein
LDKEDCSLCRFFDLQNNMQLGQCKRFPTYQNRSPNEWCGEFKFKFDRDAVAEKATLAPTQAVGDFSADVAEAREVLKPKNNKLSRRQIP